MNICFTSDYYTDFVGGGERSLASQMAALERAGHQIFLIRPYQPHQPEQSRELAIKPLFTWRIGGGVLPINPHTPMTVKQVRKFLADNHIEIVHSQGQGGISYTTLLAARKLHIPFVDTIHTFFWEIDETTATRALRPVAPLLLSGLLGYKVTPMPGDRSAIERSIRGATLTFAQKVDLVISPSQHQRDALVAAGLTTPVVCIPNPLDSTHTTTPQLLPSGVLRLVWVARMNPEKRLSTFTDALRIVHQQRPGQFEATIIGDGPDSTLAECTAQDIPEVTYAGLCDQATVLTTLDSSHLLVLTSYHFDNQPMVITEAVSRHRGVLYSDERLAPEVGPAGKLTQDASPEAFAAAIVDCIDHPEKVSELSDGCRRQIEIFQPEHFVAQVHVAYRTARENTARRAATT